MELKTGATLYGLPEQVQFCSKCVISNQRPNSAVEYKHSKDSKKTTIHFDKNQICDACNLTAQKNHSIDWKFREDELTKLCDRFRRNDGRYDCVVPGSGGKDSFFAAHILKYKYGMNPLTVTWAPLKATDIGRRNLDSFINAGFDNVLGTPNGQVTRKLTRLATQHLGDPFQPFIYGQTNYPLHMAIKHNVSLIMYGENGEVEYGGDMKNAFLPMREIHDHDKHYFSGLPPEFWIEHGLSLADLKPFMAPKYDLILDNKTEIHFLGYYKFWDPQENFYYCRENTGFEPNTERSEGTYSKYASLDDCIDGFHYYLGYVKFGIGRTTSDAAHEIRDGKITRDEGVALVKRYDGEFPKRYYQDFLNYCGIKHEEFVEIADSWRSEHLWRKTIDGWQLKYPIWDEDLKREG